VPEILVRLTGGPCNGQSVRAEIPLGLHVPVIDDEGCFSTAAYRPAGRVDVDDVPLYEFESQWCGRAPADIPADEEPAPLDPALAAYLDYPLYFHDDGVSCNKPECPCYGTGVGPYFIWTHRRQTVREFLAQVKKHAEEESGS
jgi:hypothetical protein